MGLLIVNFSFSPAPSMAVTATVWTHHHAERCGPAAHFGRSGMTQC
jgi:hypothetical protein